MEKFEELYFYLRKKILPIEIIINLIPNDSNILDLGCGKGIVLKSLKKFKRYVGVDQNISSFKNNKINAEFIKEDCLEFLKRDLNKFDVFILIDLIHHIKKKEQEIFLKKLLKLMKNGDILIVKDIYPKNMWTRYWNYMHDLLISREKITYFDFKKFQKIHCKNHLVETFYKRIFLYDHYFFILKK